MNGDAATVDLKIAAHNPGSFEVEFGIEMIRLGATMLSGPFLTSALNLRQITVAGITWLKSLRGNNEIPTELPDEQTTKIMETLELKDGDLELRAVASPETTQLALQTVSQLSTDRLVREYLQGVFGPVSQAGIERVEIRDDNNNVLETVEEDDLDSFNPFPEDANTVYVPIPRQMLKVITPYLGEVVGQWQLNDGSRTDRYDMIDEIVSDRIRSGDIRFGSGDFLECQVRHVQHIGSDGKMKTDREVLRVLGHRPKNDEEAQIRMRDL